MFCQQKLSVVRPFPPASLLLSSVLWANPTPQRSSFALTIALADAPYCFFFTEPLRPPGYVEHNNVRYAALLDSGAFSQSRLATDPYWRPLEVHDRPAQSILYRSSITSRFRITASLLSGLRLNAIVGLWRSKVSIPAARYALPGWIPTSFMLSTVPAHTSYNKSISIILNQIFC